MEKRVKVLLIKKTISLKFSKKRKKLKRKKQKEEN
jgi:hypothetical protein